MTSKELEIAYRKSAEANEPTTFTNVAEVPKATITPIDHLEPKPPKGNKLQTLIEKVRRVFSPKTSFIIADAVMKAHPGAVPSADEVAAVMKIQNQWDSIWKMVNRDLTREAARVEFARRTESFRAAVAAGKSSEGTYLDFEQLAAEFAARQQAGKDQLRVICAEAYRVCMPLRERFLSAARKYLSELERKEQQEAEDLDLDYSPSARVQAVRTLIVQLEAPKTHGHSNPRQLLPHLKQLEPSIK